MADQRGVLVKVERETGLILNEAFACVGHLPETLRDSAFTRLENRREAFQRHVDTLHEFLQQDSPAGASAETKRILERVSKLDQELAAATSENAGLLQRLSKMEREIQELRRGQAQDRPAASSAEIARLSERLSKLERENQELRRSRVEVPRAPAPPATACAEPEGEEVVSNDKFATGITLAFSGGLVQEGGKIMKKEDTSERWNAGGLCYIPKIEAGKRLGVRFQPCQSDMSVTLGFQHCVGLPSPPHHMGELEIAVHCAKDGTLEIFSQGDRVAQCGKYRPSSIVELSVNEASEVGLFMDGKFLFRHATPPRFPLYMAASFFTPGAAIRGLSWTEGTPFEGEPAPPPAPPGPRGPVNFVVRNGLQQMQPGHLRKTGGAVNWIDTAVSSESIVVGQGRGLRFRPGPSTGADYYMIGLGGTGSCPADCNGIDYAAYNWNGTFWVFESGAQKLRDGGPLSGTSVVELRVSETQVEYRVDGVLKYTGQLRGQRQLYAMASFCNPVGSEALEIQWL